MLKVVIDTNVLISGLLKGRSTRPIINAFINNAFILVTSNKVLEELVWTIRKPKLTSFIPEADSALLIALITEQARIVKPSQKLTICRDKKDNILLECALEAKADLIVTGDKDLLTLSSFRGIDIVTPSVFLRRLK